LWEKELDLTRTCWTIEIFFLVCTISDAVLIIGGGTNVHSDTTRKTEILDNVPLCAVTLGVNDKKWEAKMADYRAKYFSRTEGEFPNEINVVDTKYTKIEDLRYGTNPHQAAAFYRPKGSIGLPFADMEILKTGKSGPSETNISDIHHGISIVKYFVNPACSVMKHMNPSGAAVARPGEVQKDVYIHARDADARAAFGGTVCFNTTLNAETAEEIMQSVIEVVAAPDFEDEALKILNDFERFKKNKEIRIFRLPNIGSLPKFVGDPAAPNIKVLGDGSLIVSELLLTKVRTANDLLPAVTEHPKHGKFEIARIPTEREYDDLMFSWYVNLNVRSNGVVIARDGVTLAVGTGEQDRVGAVEQAIDKAKRKFSGNETLEGAVLSSDGFFPMRDSIDVCAKEGITAIVQPGGSVRDWEVIQAANEHGIAMVFTDERIFSHH
jgi:phosphoribosylaminoimidazolecarboxamide formyltransferase/IMP cyclohydrolase